MLLGLACALVNYLALSKFGLSKDIWTLEPSAIMQFAISFYAQQVLYITLLACVKMTFLLFYLRIFTERRTQRLLWATIVVNTHFALGFIVLSAAQCRPIRYYWTQFVDEGFGACIPAHIVARINGGVSVVMDIWIILIPLFQVNMLQLYWKRKVVVLLKFFTGIL